ncbi:MAG: helicase-exonuclease AddAB subunit AddA [Oscillospiraceae bacterium]|jgi:ATP-dependent helicase/nuclease subunit A|nr:helicase-exonuclease AddAB subunit AddA [Oscillospiraceae bacterium]
MHNLKWTKSQQDAISVSGGSVVVSAAAGSGKTEILSQRVIEKICCVENPNNINDFLIVTFTNAAAEEMKCRITKKLYDLASSSPKNSHLKHQQILLQASNISTVHGFCNKLIKENFTLANVCPTFKIANESQVSELKAKALDFVLEEAYAKKDPSFMRLLQNVSKLDDDQNLIQLVKEVYEFSNSIFFPNIWFKSVKEKLSTENFSLWIDIIFDYSLEIICYFKNIVLYLINLINNHKNLTKAYFKVLEADLVILNETEFFICKKNWENLRKNIKSIVFLRLGVCKEPEKEEIKIKILEYRNKIKKYVSKLLELFSPTIEDIKSDALKTLEFITPLFELVENFRKKFQRLKEEKDLLDFSDLEHFALKLLVKQTDNISSFKKTKLAEKISEQFSEVLIDEYQDTSEIQDVIFRAVSKNEKNLFIVGDVKQSVYSFRQAKPEIFLKRKEAVNFFSQKEKNRVFPTKIILSENFRSENEMLKFTNFIFKMLMTKETSSIDYDDEEAFKTTNLKSPRYKNEVYILEKLKSSEEEKQQLEAEFIANKIKKAILEENIQPKDFCILLRNTSGKALIFKEALKKHNIPVVADVSGNFFENEEVSFIISFLKVIDNPTSDIDLARLMISPIFDFSIEELTKIRLSSTNVSVYECLIKHAETNKKCSIFLEKIKFLKKISLKLGFSELLFYLYKNFDLSLLTISETPREKQKNLDSLLSFAMNMESLGCNTLLKFLDFIEKSEKNNDQFSGLDQNSCCENAVTIMSIHKSKGLEFPICILANSSSRFYQNNNNIVLDEILGVGIEIFDSKNMCKFSSIQKEAILIKMRKDQLAEELRILYVALTRAKKRMIITLAVDKLEKSLKQFVLDETVKPSDFNIKNAKSCGDLLLMCLLRHSECNSLREIIDFKEIFSENLPGIKLRILKFKEDILEKSKRKTKQIKDAANVLPLRIKFTDSLNKKVPLRIFETPETENEKTENLNKISRIPLQVSVLDLIKNKTKNFKTSELKFLKPKFLKDRECIGKERGNYYHKFLQFADLKILNSDIEKCFKDILERKILNKEEIDNIDKNKIKIFSSSNLFTRIISSKNVLREYFFTVFEKIDSKKILVEGIVDCVFEEKNKLIVVDYKTDVASKKEILVKYSDQLEFYCQALEKCTGKNIKEAIFYSFYLDKEIKINKMFSEYLSYSSNKKNSKSF